MFKTFRISYALENTYRVNSILYSLKQIPLIRRLLPAALYRSRGLKILAMILAAVWEGIAAFGGKAIYLYSMVMGLAGLYQTTVPTGQIYVHILFFLSLIGAYMNTYMFNPTNDKYYAMILMRMDARRYTLSNYMYNMIKVFAGFLVFGLLSGTACGVPVGVCLTFPFLVVGLKLISAWITLRHFKKTGDSTNENLPPKAAWLLTAALLAAAYGLPALGIVMPVFLFVFLSVLAVLGGAAAAAGIFRFPLYREMYQQILSSKREGMDQRLQKAVASQRERLISPDSGIVSQKSGFEYLNELFMKRHQKILWKSAKKVSIICILVFTGLFVLLLVLPEVREKINSLLMTYLPYFVFIMYAVNRGTAFTQALFMNCDHSLLTYSFYKQPHNILRLFQIRLREIIKINLLPAFTIGIGLALLLLGSGGTGEPAHYVILLISILSMSIFFSVHYLTLYYLLQPYNVNTEMKSGTYQIAMSATYLVCFFLMQVRMDTMLFGLMIILFCVLYSISACILIFRFAGKTFRLRN